MTKLEEIALAIFQKVTSDEEAEWDTMSSEERDDALEWARAGWGAARDPGAKARMEGDLKMPNSWGAEFVWVAIIDALLSETE